MYLYIMEYQAILFSTIVENIATEYNVTHIFDIILLYTGKKAATGFYFKKVYMYVYVCTGTYQKIRYVHF